MKATLSMSPYGIAFLLCLCMFSFVNASSEIDSLQTTLAAQRGTERVRTLINLAVSISSSDIPAGQRYSEEALRLAEQLKDPKILGKAVYNNGYLLHLSDDFIRAEAAYNRAKDIFKANDMPIQLSETYGRLGHLYTIKGEYKRSLAIYEKALQIAKESKDSMTASITIFSMAHAYNYLGESEQAFTLLEESRPLIKHRGHLIYYHAILGDIHREKGEFKKALEALFASRAICQEMGDALREGYMSQAIAETYVEQGNYAQGAKYHLEVLRLNEQVDSKALTLGSFIGLGDLYLLWNEAQESYDNYKKALDLALATQIKEKLPFAFGGLAKAALALEKRNEALKWFEEAAGAAKEMNLLEEELNYKISISQTLIQLKEYDKALAQILTTISRVPLNHESKDCWQSALLEVLGQTYLHKNDLNQAQSYLEKGVEFANKCDNKEKVFSIYLSLSELHQRNGEFEQSAIFFKKYLHLKEDLLNEANNKELVAIRGKMENVQKEKEIKMLQKEKEIQALTLLQQQTELSRKEMYLLVLGLIFLVSILLSMGFFSRFRMKKRLEKLKFENKQVALENQNLEKKQQLEMAELRSNFFTNVSHEFRTPLTLLLGPLRDLRIKEMNPGKIRILDRMQRNADRLLQLVNQTLDFSKMQHHAMPLLVERINMKGFCEQLINNFSAISIPKQIQLIEQAIDPNLVFEGDVDKLRKMFSNLMSNALEHTKAGGTVVLSAVAKVGKEDFAQQKVIEIRVADTGCGIAPHHTKHIFDRYYQVDTQKETGFGIGLALCKEIIEKHNGKVAVNSQVGQGTSFIITLPLLQAQGVDTGLAPKHSELFALPAAAAAQSNPAISLAKQGEKELSITVLVVDDHQDMRAYLQELMQSQGFQVLSAENAKKGMSMCIQYQPDLIISDVMMPEISGFEFAEQLKKEFMTSHIPLILLTAKATHESKMMGLEKGIDDYLVKPFRSDELLMRCNNLIKQRKKLKTIFEADPFVCKEKKVVNEIDDKFLKKALRFVEKRIEDPSFNVERFCREIGMSRTKLYTKLKALTGKNISEFIKMIRLRKAAELIENNTGNIIEIASKVGFNSRQSFNKSFKDFFGVSPTAYKKKKQSRDKLIQA